MNLTFISDPGHGWLEVPMAEVARVAIVGVISGYSYVSRDGKTAYLEEDCDAPKYLEALKARGEPEPVIKHHNCNADAFIRRLPRFVRPLPDSLRTKL